MEEAQTKKQKMSIMSEDVKKTLTCCVDTKTTHYAFEAIFVPCGGNACKKCIEKLDDDEESVTCGFCGQDHSKEEMLKMGANTVVKYLIEAYLDGLREQLVNDLNEAREGLSEERMNEDVDLRFDNVEFELDTRIESIIAALHEYRDGFKSEMDELKEKYKRHLKNKGFQEIKKELDSLNKDTLAADYDDFMRTHTLLNESKKKLESYVRQLNEIKMSDSTIVYKDLIGELRIPFWKKLISCDEYPIDHVESILYRCCYLKSKNQLIMIEVDKRTLINYNLEDNSYDPVEHERIHSALQICAGKDDQIFILDVPKPGENKMVLVFDSDFKYKREFKTNSFQVDFMAIDVNSEPNLLYLSECDRNEISACNSETGESIKTIQIDSPQFIAITKEFIYVTSYTNYETDDEGKFDKITRGSNCIFVLNRQTHEIVDRIEFTFWLNPYGLSLDENENLITMADDFDKDNRISKNSFLYVINGQHKELVDKVELEDGVGCISNSNLYFDNKLAVLSKSKLQLIEFDYYN